MASMDIFAGNAFSAISLTNTVEITPFKPSLLGSLGIFTPKPIRTKVAAIEQRNNTLSLIQTSERGAPLELADRNRRKIHSVTTPRIAKADSLFADEIANIRAYGSESELMQVQDEVARRFLTLRQDVEYTHENMRLGAVQGKVLDADGSTIVDWETVMGVSMPAEIDFDLDAASPASGVVRKKCAEVVRSMMRAGGGAWLPGTEVIGLCGDAFFDDLIAHTEVRSTYLNQAAAAELRDGYAFEQVRYGGITFINYRSSDDGGSSPTVGIGTDKCKFFPRGGASDLFQMVLSPGESFDFVNTPGRDVYAMQIPDRERNAWVKFETYSYPLMVCTRPNMLHRAKRT